MSGVQQEYNIYCDESCHLEHDGINKMTLGGIWCSKDSTKRLSKEIRRLKKIHNAGGELKWTKVSHSRIAFYRELVEFFFKEQDLHFRCLIVDDKSKLDHRYFNGGSHDTFYYKMYFTMLKTIIFPEARHFIYLDIKDTRSRFKIKKLKEVLCNSFRDFSYSLIANIQHIRSHESEILQLADFFIGAVTYANRGLTSNDAKVDVIRRIEKNIGADLKHTSSWSNEKFNILIFSPQEVVQC